MKRTVQQIAPALLLGAAMVAAPLAHAVIIATERPSVVTSDLSLPFSGSFVDDTSSQTIDIQGSVKVITHVTVSGDATNVNVYMDMPTALGTGRKDGCAYILYGSNHAQQNFAADSLNTMNVVGAFSVPSTPIRPNDRLCPTPQGARVYLGLNLRFTSNGKLVGVGDNGSTVQVCGEKPCFSE